MKNILALLSFYVLIVGCFSKPSHNPKLDEINDLVNYLKNSDIDNLNDDLKKLAQMIKQDARAGADHYCCAVPTRNETYETRTRVVTFNTIATTQHIIGYEICGNSSSTFRPPTTRFGQTSPIIPTVPPCENKPIYQTVTYLATQYRLETYNVPIVVVDCPVQHIICCENYTMFNGQCIPTALLGNLQDLINLGIIG